MNVIKTKELTIYESELKVNLTPDGDYCCNEIQEMPRIPQAWTNCPFCGEKFIFIEGRPKVNAKEETSMFLMNFFKTR